VGTPAARLSEAQRDDLDALSVAIVNAGGVPCSNDTLTISESDADQQEGTHWCARCPILDTCRAYGLTWPDEIGVYGGLTHKQRQRAARQEGTAA